MDNLSIQNTMPDHHSPPLILIADDHVDSVDLLEQRLENAGYRTAGAYDGEEALAQVEKLHPDLLLLDLLMPKLSGIEVVAQLRGKPEFQDLPIIMLTAKTEMGDRIAGLDAGADEYLTKPTEEGELLARVRAMLRMREALHSKQHLEEENERLRREVALREGWEEFVGHSEPMQEVYGLIEKVAAAPAAVLITGESGTGKELVARAIHRRGNRKEYPFIPVQCGALPESLLETELFGHKRGSFTGADADREGVFEAARGGTLFLDEVGDVSVTMQARLLRVLQEGEVTPVGESQPRPIDVRIIAATNKGLKSEVQAGNFREDLYYRLNVIPISLPSLRQRREDILHLAEHFLQRYCQALGRGLPMLTSEAKRALLDYGWPGNVRELEHEMERVATLSDPDCMITPELLSEEVRVVQSPLLPETPMQEGTLKETMGQIERRLLEEALERDDWNQTRTAEHLGLTRQGLIKKLQKYGIKGRGGR
jgi:DNA-binding NtrC family response regulator